MGARAGGAPLRGLQARDRTGQGQAGRWRLEIDSSSSALRAGVRRQRDGALVATGGSGLQFELGAPTEVGIAIVAPAGLTARANAIRLALSR